MKTQILTKNGLDIYTEEIKEYIKNRDIVATTSPELKNSYDSWLKVNDFYGESKQMQTTGKNKLPFPYYSALPYTTQGVTFTDAKNGIVNVNGTSTGDAYIDLYNNQNEMLTRESVIFSKDSVNNVTLFYFERIDGKWSVGQNTTESQTEIKITPSENATGQIFRITLQNGKTANNITVKPMIRLASNTDSTWEPYTNGPSPNPDYPQPIESTVVNRVDVSGNQLYDANAINVHGNKSVEVLDNGYTIVVTGGTGGSYTNSYIALNDYIPLEFLKGKTLYVNADSFTSTQGSSTEALYQTVIFTPSGTQYFTKNKKVPIPSDATRITVGIYTNNTASALATDNTVTVKGLRISFIENVPWEEYKGFQTVNLSAPIELNGIGGVRDSDKVKKFGVVVLDGSNDEEWYKHDEQYPHLFRTYIKPLAKGLKSVLCSHFPYDEGNLMGGLDGCRFRNEEISTVFYISSSKHTDVSTFRSWLANNPVTLVYELAEPIETALPQGDIDALNNLRTYNGTTIITTDSNLSPIINLEYSTSTLGSYVLDAYHQFLFNKSGIKLLDDSNYEPLE